MRPHPRRVSTKNAVSVLICDGIALKTEEPDVQSFFSGQFRCSLDGETAAVTPLSVVSQALGPVTLVSFGLLPMLCPAK